MCIRDRSYLSLTYREWAGAVGVRYSVETSRDLSSWASADQTTEVGAPMDHGDGIVSRTFRSLSPLPEPGGREFIRLHMAAEE